MASFLDSSKKNHVLMIGDSITEWSFDTEHCGFGASMSHWYRRTADVVNRGYSGYNSRWIRQIITKLVSSESTIIATVFLGANDSAVDILSQYVPVEEYSENLKFIVNHVRQLHPNCAVILITPPRVDNVRWPARHDNQVSPFAESVVALAAEMNTGLVNLWTGDNAIVVEDTHDGLHLNESGNRKVFKLLQAEIRRKYPHLAPDEKADETCNMTMHYPVWSELASKSTEETQAILESWKW